MHPQDHNQPPIPFGQPQPPGAVEIITHGRKLHMYSVTDPELESLRESGLSATVDMSLFALCGGILVTLIITLSTVDIKDAKTFAAYVGASIVSAIFSIWFGARAGIAWRNAKAKLKEIKSTS
jgi:hypothetical protein